MKAIRFNPVKSARLKRTRGVSFEEILSSRLVDIRRHPVEGNQKVMVFEYRSYFWAVPYVENETEIFLKTIYPSRKLMKIYGRRRI